MSRSQLIEILADLCSISIRLASLDIPTFDMALRVFKSQSAISSAQANLCSILFELLYVPSSSVSHKEV